MLFNKNMSESLEVNKKDVLKKMLANFKVELIQKEAQERFLQRRDISGDKQVRMPLGQVQAEIKYAKGFIDFLEEIIEEE